MKQMQNVEAHLKLWINDERPTGRIRDDSSIFCRYLKFNKLEQGSYVSKALSLWAVSCASGQVIPTVVHESRN